MLEGCESAAVPLLIQLPPPNCVGCAPASHRRMILAWLLSDWLQHVATPSTGVVSELVAAAGSGHQLWDLDLVLYPNMA